MVTPCSPTRGPGSTTSGEAVQFHRDANAEYRAALAWYAARSLDAADGFADSIALGIRGIREAWPMWRGRSDVRVRFVRRYPYSLVYVVRDPKIVIIAVAHQRRRPGYWLSRMLG